MASLQPRFVGALDQGTTGPRFMVFDHDGRLAARRALCPGLG